MLAGGVQLYFVRHGETDWNLAQRYQGRQDVPLNRTGRAQAARNGRALAQALGRRAATLDYVASPLMRARETMEIVREELGLGRGAYRLDDRLAEINYGHWEGQLWRSCRARIPKDLRRAKPTPGIGSPTGVKATERCRSASLHGWQRSAATAWSSLMAASCACCAV